jgi:hypothetical protein
MERIVLDKQTKQEAGQTDTLDRRKYNVNMIILFNQKKIFFLNFEVFKSQAQITPADLVPLMYSSKRVRG